MIDLERRGTLKDGRTQGWFYCENALFNLQISKYAKLVFLYLCRCASDGDTCFPSFQDISKKTGCSHGVVGRALRELDQKRLIRRESRRTERGRRTSTLYTILRVQKVDTVEVDHGQPADTVRVQAVDSVQRVDSKKKHSKRKEEITSAPEGAAAPVAPCLSASEILGSPVLVVASDLHGSQPAAPPARPRQGNIGHPAVVRYCARWKVHHGLGPTITGKRIGILTNIYKRLEGDPEINAPEEYDRLLEALFRSQDSFIISSAHSPEVFLMKLDALRSRSGARTAQRGSIISNQDVTEVRECNL
jgi:hypothetical protein